MERLQLKAMVRDSKHVHPEKLRKQGFLPVVLYGHKINTTSLTVMLNEFEKIFKKAGESTIINLETNDGVNHPVLIHDIQYHYLNSQPIHADFFEVSMTEKLKAKVALEFTGEAPAVKTLGGVLVKILSEVEVECLPADLPHTLIVDIVFLKTFDRSIHVKDLKLPTNVKITNPPDEVIAKVQPPRDIEAELAPAVADEKTAVEAVVAASEKLKPAEDSKNATEEKVKKE